MRLGDLARRLARVRLVDPERDLIERLDRLDVAAGTLRWAATSAPDADAVLALVEKLRRAAPELEHDVRVVADDRAERLGDRGFPRWVRAAFAARPSALFLAFSWRRRTRPPPRTIPRLRIGPALGYPRCCVRFEEDRRALLIAAEARGMIETWSARTTEHLLLGMDMNRPFLVDEGDDEARILRLRTYPFVSYVPCPSCCARAASPAARENERRRAFARAVAPSLARSIERVRGLPS